MIENVIKLQSKIDEKSKIILSVFAIKDKQAGDKSYKNYFVGSIHIVSENRASVLFESQRKTKQEALDVTIQYLQLLRKVIGSIIIDGTSLQAFLQQINPATKGPNKNAIKDQVSGKGVSNDQG